MERTRVQALALAERADRFVALREAVEHVAPCGLVQVPSLLDSFHFVYSASVVDAASVESMITRGKDAAGLPLTKRWVRTTGSRVRLGSVQ
jgi:hypothetical protein